MTHQRARRTTAGWTRPASLSSRAKTARCLPWRGRPCGEPRARLRRRPRTRWCRSAQTQRRAPTPHILHVSRRVTELRARRHKPRGKPAGKTARRGCTALKPREARYKPRKQPSTSTAHRAARLVSSAAEHEAAAAASAALRGTAEGSAPPEARVTRCCGGCRGAPRLARRRTAPLGSAVCVRQPDRSSMALFLYSSDPDGTGC